MLVFINLLGKEKLEEMTQNDVLRPGRPRGAFIGMTGASSGGLRQNSCNRHIHEVPTLKIMNRM